MQALDSSNNVISQSPSRSFIVTGSSSAQSTLPKEFQSNDLLAKDQPKGHFAVISAKDLVAAKSIPVTPITEGLLKRELPLEKNENYLAAIYPFDRTANKKVVKTFTDEFLMTEINKQFPNLKLVPVKNSRISTLRFSAHE